MPSFTIEAEGEANPLSSQFLINTLASVTSASTNNRNQDLTVATSQISNWESVPGFYVLLQDVWADDTLPEDIRFQAIIQLKNGIDKHWRKTATRPIGKEEKDKIKSRTIESGVRQNSDLLASHNALMLAKIVRYEFPHDWPDVITNIVHHLRQAVNSPIDSRYTVNILSITLQVIKELASGRLQRTKRSLYQSSPEILHALAQIYAGMTNKLLESNFQDAKSGQLAHQAMKSLRRLLVAGFEHPHRESAVVEVWSLIQSHYSTLSTISRAVDTEAVDYQYLIKMLMQYSKLWLEMAKDHAASFVLMGANDVLHQSWMTIKATQARRTAILSSTWEVLRSGDTDDGTVADKLALKALLLFRACVKMVFNPAQTFKYQTPQDKEDKKLAMDLVRSKFLTESFVVELMEVIVTAYLVLQPSDLHEWEEDPDEWERREDQIADAWEFSIRSCSEKLFLDLIIHFKDLLVPRLLKVFERYANTTNSDILLKDSLYSALGIAAACLEDIFDFNNFLHTTLVPEVQIVAPGYNLLRRRTALLLAQWVPIKPTVIDRVAVYQIFTHLLTSTDSLNDHVVQVTAGRQLRLVLEPFEFDYKDFAPYATSILQSLLTLINTTDLSETKMALLETVRVVVTKLEGHIEPYAEGIMLSLPPLWQQSGEEHLMKQAILTMITAVVTSLGKSSVAFHSAVLPLIHDSVQPDSEAVVYLLEEALDLWAAILQQTPSKDPSPSEALLTLSHSLLPLLGLGSESLRQVFELTESYTFLSPQTVLSSAFLRPFLESTREFLPLISSSRARDASLAPQVIENLINVITVSRALSVEARRQALEHLLALMVDTRYLHELLEILKQAYDYHQDPRPNRRPPDIIGPGETNLFSLLARIAWAAPDLLVNTIVSLEGKIDWFITEWIAHFDAIGDIQRKKFQVLAITNLFLAQNPPAQIMLENFQSFMTIWTDIGLELGQEPDEQQQGDYLFHGVPEENQELADSTPEDDRKRHVSNNDPTYTVNIRTFLEECLRQIFERCGGPQAFEREWLSRIDEPVMKAFVAMRLFRK